MLGEMGLEENLRQSKSEERHLGRETRLVVRRSMRSFSPASAVSLVARFLSRGYQKQQFLIMSGIIDLVRCKTGKPTVGSVEQRDRMNAEDKTTLLGLFFKEAPFSGGPSDHTPGTPSPSPENSPPAHVCFCLHPHLRRENAMSIVLLGTNLYFVLKDLGFSVTREDPAKHCYGFPGSSAVLAKSGNH